MKEISVQELQKMDFGFHKLADFHNLLKEGFIISNDLPEYADLHAYFQYDIDTNVGQVQSLELVDQKTLNKKLKHKRIFNVIWMILTLGFIVVDLYTAIKFPSNMTYSVITGTLFSAWVLIYFVKDYFDSKLKRRIYSQKHQQYFLPKSSVLNENLFNLENGHDDTGKTKSEVQISVLRLIYEDMKTL